MSLEIPKQSSIAQVPSSRQQRERKRSISSRGNSVGNNLDGRGNGSSGGVELHSRERDNNFAETNKQNRNEEIKNQQQSDLTSGNSIFFSSSQC